MTEKELQQLKIDLASGDLKDRKANGKERPWNEKKGRNMMLAEVFDAFDPVRGEKLRDCGSFLAFTIRDDGKLQLKRANFCRIRLCPVCQWRKSLAAHAQMRQILDWCNEKKKLRYIFVTLTVRNMTLAELIPAINDMMKAFDRLMQYKAIAGRKGGEPTVKGWHRSLEVTHDVDKTISPSRYNARRKYYDGKGIKPGDANPNYDTYHPHFHMVWAVSPSYFNGKTEYITQKKLGDLWAKALRSDYVPMVNIKIVKGVKIDNVTSAGADSLKTAEISVEGAVCEATKYAVKDADYIIPDDFNLTLETVKGLDRALHGRRLIARGGIFADAFKALKLAESEDADLVHINDDDSGDAPEWSNTPALVYVWYSGYSQYKRDT